MLVALYCSDFPRVDKFLLPSIDWQTFMIHRLRLASYQHNYHYLSKKVAIQKLLYIPA